MLTIEVLYNGNRESLRPHRQPTKLLVREHTVLVALRVGERGQHEAIFHVRPMTEGKRFQQL
ncbi:MAG: hypothetical protein JSV66_02470, partial [Trueperaceae bacterium]